MAKGRKGRLERFGQNKTASSELECYSSSCVVHNSGNILSEKDASIAVIHRCNGILPTYKKVSGDFVRQHRLNTISNAKTYSNISDTRLPFP